MEMMYSEAQILDFYDAEKINDEIDISLQPIYEDEEFWKKDLNV